jgi:hypothetical protein
MELPSSNIQVLLIIAQPHSSRPQIIISALAFFTLPRPGRIAACDTTIHLSRYEATSLYLANL